MINYRINWDCNCNLSRLEITQRRRGCIWRKFWWSTWPWSASGAWGAACPSSLGRPTWWPSIRRRETTQTTPTSTEPEAPSPPASPNRKPQRWSGCDSWRDRWGWAWEGRSQPPMAPRTRTDSGLGGGGHPFPFLFLRWWPGVVGAHHRPRPRPGHRWWCWWWVVGCCVDWEGGGIWDRRWWCCPSSPPLESDDWLRLCLLPLPLMVDEVEGEGDVPRRECDWLNEWWQSRERDGIESNRMEGMNWNKSVEPRVTDTNSAAQHSPAQ